MYGELASNGLLVYISQQRCNEVLWAAALHESTLAAALLLLVALSVPPKIVPGTAALVTSPPQPPQLHYCFLSR